MGLWLGGMIARLRSRLSEALSGGSRLIGGIMGMEEAISNRLMTPRGVIEDLSNQLLPNTGTTVWGSLLAVMLLAIAAHYSDHTGSGMMGLSLN